MKSSLFEDTPKDDEDENKVVEPRVKDTPDNLLSVARKQDTDKIKPRRPTGSEKKCKYL